MLSCPCTTGSSQDHLWLSWPNVFTVPLSPHPPSGIGLFLFNLTNKTMFYIDRTNTPLTRAFDFWVSNVQLYTSTKSMYPFLFFNKHQWSLPISTCYNVTHPVKLKYHQHWSFFVVHSISVSLAKSPEFFSPLTPKFILMPWILLHMLRQHRSGLPNTPGGGITTLDFMVKMCLGDSATSLLTC